MSMHHLTGKRILCQFKIDSRYSTSMIECQILEVSPSGECVKFTEDGKSSYWKRANEIRICEVLNGGAA